MTVSGEMLRNFLEKKLKPEKFQMQLNRPSFETEFQKIPLADF